MKLHALIVAAIVALLAIAAVSINYIISVGTKPPDPATWGQFGDYFGGILNPLFALAAFLSALWSISVQQREARASAKELALQTDIARRELEALTSDKLGEELLHVIRDIDGRLSVLFQTNISPPKAEHAMMITHMIAEAQRVGSFIEASDSFTEFVSLARQSGTVIEALVREIRYLVVKLREFLEHYSNHKASSYAPVLVYYADKAYQVVPMLEAVGGVPDDTRRFFATISDAHG